MERMLMYDLNWYWANYCRIAREVAVLLGGTYDEALSLSVQELFALAKALGVKIEG